MFSRPRLILYMNLVLFFYTLIDFNRRLFAVDNLFAQVATGAGNTLRDLMAGLPSLVNQFQVVIYIIVLALLILLALRFFNVAFVLMEIAVLLTLINYAMQWFNNQQNINSLFEAAVILVTLASIWAIAKPLKLVK
ncbi:hypothetical protein [Lactococcus termiticola]|uniref:Uncharacterized protein n=1 Tax=Lactococcus termiticola TaxID=2169526 RepID=A0A2R5HEZ2_9LACT|nr:hypothetical protein [Lactococcus termiticola]GBG96634.1 hypothetical protein NtB2_00758 [Lactococcus termiticola]